MSYVLQVSAVGGSTISIYGPYTSRRAAEANARRHEQESEAAGTPLRCVVKTLGDPQSLPREAIDRHADISRRNVERDPGYFTDRSCAPESQPASRASEPSPSPTGPSPGPPCVTTASDECNQSAFGTRRRYVELLERWCALHVIVAHARAENLALDAYSREAEKRKWATVVAQAARRQDALNVEIAELSRRVQVEHHFDVNVPVEAWDEELAARAFEGLTRLSADGTLDQVGVRVNGDSFELI